jgi:hypothetical protein
MSRSCFLLVVLFTTYACQNDDSDTDEIIVNESDTEEEIIVNETVEFCRPFGINEDIVECVVNNVGRHYNYTARNNSDRVLLLVDEFKTEGYVCRDVAVAYNAIFRKLGFTVDYIFTRAHVYNTVYNSGNGSYLDCTINMDRYHCWGY